MEDDFKNSVTEPIINRNDIYNEEKDLENSTPKLISDMDNIIMVENDLENSAAEHIINRDDIFNVENDLENCTPVINKAELKTEIEEVLKKNHLMVNTTGIHDPNSNEATKSKNDVNTNSEYISNCPDNGKNDSHPKELASKYISKRSKRKLTVAEQRALSLAQEEDIKKYDELLALFLAKENLICSYDKLKALSLEKETQVSDQPKNDEYVSKKKKRKLTVAEQRALSLAQEEDIKKYYWQKRNPSNMLS